MIIRRSHAPSVFSSVRRQIVARLRSGEAVAAVAIETGICEATLFRWKRQALIDAGAIEGVPSVEVDELAAAHKRIAQLEAELALTRDACELFNDEAVVPQNADARSLRADRARIFSPIRLPDHGINLIVAAVPSAQAHPGPAGAAVDRR